MGTLNTWLYIVAAVLIALAANSISAIWAGKEDKFTLWLLALILISPLVFIAFGLVTAKIGLTVSSGTIDALLTVSTIFVGLLFFREFHMMTTYQYIGIAFTIIGIVLMHYTR